MKNNKEFDPVNTLKWFAIAVATLTALIALSPIVFLIHLVVRFKHKHYDLGYYFQSIAIGMDVLGASLIYGSKTHTISGITGHREDYWHKNIQRPIIDALFGRDHCVIEAKDEFKETV